MAQMCSVYLCVAVYVCAGWPPAHCAHLSRLTLSDHGAIATFSLSAAPSALLVIARLLGRCAYAMYRLNAILLPARGAFRYTVLCICIHIAVQAYILVLEFIILTLQLRFCIFNRFLLDSQEI